jgi:hypothetical protein
MHTKKLRKGKGINGRLARENKMKVSPPIKFPSLHFFLIPLAVSL